MKAKKCASRAGDAWAFDFARIALLVSGLRPPGHPRTQNRGPRRSRGVPGPGEPSWSTFFLRYMSLFSETCHFLAEKTAGGNRENLKQGLGAAARPAAAAARPEKAAARPEPPRRPGGRREAKIRKIPKMLKMPLGGSGGLWGLPLCPPVPPWGPMGAHGAPWGPLGPHGPPLRCGSCAKRIVLLLVAWGPLRRLRRRRHG